MDHEHDVPGAGPVRIVALEDGDAPGIPHWVEAQLRRAIPTRRSADERADLIATFRRDYSSSGDERHVCLHDWLTVYPDLSDDIDRVAGEVEHGAPPPPRAREPDLSPAPAPTSSPDPSPLSPPPSRPTVIALGVCYVALVLVTCLLAALRTGSAIAWDWGWVLAPVWLPLVLGTIALIMASIVLAFWDERDASRRRSS